MSESVDQQGDHQEMDGNIQNHEQSSDETDSFTGSENTDQETQSYHGNKVNRNQGDDTTDNQTIDISLNTDGEEEFDKNKWCFEEKNSQIEMVTNYVTEDGGSLNDFDEAEDDIELKDTAGESILIDCCSKSKISFHENEDKSNYEWREDFSETMIDHDTTCPKVVADGTDDNCHAQFECCDSENIDDIFKNGKVTWYELDDHGSIDKGYKIDLSKNINMIPQDQSKESTQLSSENVFSNKNDTRTMDVAEDTYFRSFQGLRHDVLGSKLHLNEFDYLYYNFDKKQCDDKANQALKPTLEKHEREDLVSDARKNEFNDKKKITARDIQASSCFDQKIEENSSSTIVKLPVATQNPVSVTDTCIRKEESDNPFDGNSEKLKDLRSNTIKDIDTTDQILMRVEDYGDLLNTNTNVRKSKSDQDFQEKGDPGCFHGDMKPLKSLKGKDTKKLESKPKKTVVALQPRDAAYREVKKVDMKKKSSRMSLVESHNNHIMGCYYFGSDFFNHRLLPTISVDILQEECFNIFFCSNQNGLSFEVHLSYKHLNEFLFTNSDTRVTLHNSVSIQWKCVDRNGNVSLGKVIRKTLFQTGLQESEKIVESFEHVEELYRWNDRNARSLEWLPQNKVKILSKQEKVKDGEPGDSLTATNHKWQSEYVRPLNKIKMTLNHKSRVFGPTISLTKEQREFEVAYYCWKYFRVENVDKRQYIQADDFLFFVVSSNYLQIFLFPVYTISDGLSDFAQEMMDNPNMTERQQMRFEHVRLASLRNLPGNFTVMATFLAKNGHYMPPAINSISTQLQTECYRCGMRLIWNHDTTADGRMLHYEDCELIRFDDQPVGVNRSALQVVEIRDVDGSSTLQDVRNTQTGPVSLEPPHQSSQATQSSDSNVPVTSSVASGNSDIVSRSSNVLDSTSIASGSSNFVSRVRGSDRIPRVTEYGNGQLYPSGSSSSTSRQSVNQILAHGQNYWRTVCREILMKLKIINYCSVISIFEGLYQTICDHEEKDAILANLHQSEFQVYMVLHEVFLKLRLKQTEEAVRIWIFNLFSIEEICKKWLKWDENELVINMFGNENNTVLKKLNEALLSRFEGCSCEMDKIELWSTDTSNVSRGEILQHTVKDFMETHINCRDTSFPQSRSSKRRFVKQPLILPLPLIWLNTEREDLTKILDVAGVRYLLGFYSHLENEHYTAFIYRHSSDEWKHYDFLNGESTDVQSNSQPQQNEPSRDPGCMTTAFYILRHLPS